MKIDSCMIFFFFNILYLDCILLFYACLVLGSFIAISSNSLSFFSFKEIVSLFLLCVPEPKVHMWALEDISVESFISFHPYLSFRDRIHKTPGLGSKHLS